MFCFWRRRRNHYRLHDGLVALFFLTSSLVFFPRLTFGFASTTLCASAKPICITVYSDIAVPWCYVAHKRLEKALNRYRTSHANQEGGGIQVHWKPIQFDSDTSPDGELLQDYNRRKWGGGSTKWIRRVKARGRGERGGASFKNWKWWPNTVKAHQLVHFAQRYGGIDGMKASSVVYKELYEEGENISNVNVLVKIGVEKLGLPAAPMREYLQNDKGWAHIQDDTATALAKHNIQTLPFFVIVREDSGDLPYKISGAPSSGTFVAYLMELGKDEEERCETFVWQQP